MPEGCVVWTGSLLWPQDLPDAELIDMGAVSMAGAWLIEELRQRGRRRVIGASDRIKQMLELGEAPVLWYKTLKEATQLAGVTASERLGLLGEPAADSLHLDVEALDKRLLIAQTRGGQDE